MNESNRPGRPAVVAATAKAIDALPAADTEAGYFKHYSGNLAVRVMPARQGKTPVKTLCLYYQDVSGQRRPHKLGRYRRTTEPARPGYLTLKEANDKIDRLMEKMAEGIYPTTAAAKACMAAPAEGVVLKFATMTVSQLVDAYLAFTGKTEYRAPKTHRENQLQLAILTEALGSRPAISITPDDAAALAMKVANRDRVLKTKSTKTETSDGMARGFISTARKAFNWQFGEEGGAAYINPFSFAVKRAKIKAIMASSSHVPHMLNNVEIAHVWHLLADVNGPGSASVARALLLTLLTGQRPGEVASMLSTEIHPSNYVSLHTGGAEVAGKWWVIPWQKRKMRRKKEKLIKVDLLVYLPPLAVKIIGDYTGPIFPSPVAGQSIAESSMSQLVNKKLTNIGQWLGLSKEWRPNDLRKTMRSKLPALKCPWDICERIIGHQVGELDTTYNLYDYAEDKAQWVTAWADHLADILSKAGSVATDVRLDDNYDVNELRHLVATMSLTAAGQRLGISGNAVKKRCQKHGIVWPDQGHWIKTEHRGYKNVV